MAKVKLLYLTQQTNPQNLLDFAAEQKAIEAALVATRRNAIEVVPKPDEETSHLDQLNADHEPTIVHISAHGEPHGGTTKVWMFEANKKAALVAQDTMTRILVRFGERRARLVVLNVCHSSPLAEAVVGAPGSRIDAAIGMSGEIKTRLVAVFSGALYGSLARGESLQTAFDAACDALGDAAKGTPKLHPRKGIDPRKWFLPRHTIAWVAVPIVAAAALAVLAWVIWPESYLQCMGKALGASREEKGWKDAATALLTSGGRVDVSRSNRDEPLVRTALKRDGWAGITKCVGASGKGIKPYLMLTVDVEVEDGDGKSVSDADVRLENADPTQLSVHEGMSCRGNRCSRSIRLDRPHDPSKRIVIAGDQYERYETGALTLTELVSGNRLKVKRVARETKLEPKQSTTSAPTTAINIEPAPKPCSTTVLGNVRDAASRVLDPGVFEDLTLTVREKKLSVAGCSSDCKQLITAVKSVVSVPCTGTVRVGRKKDGT